VVLIESSFTDASWRELAAQTGRDADGTVVWLRGDHDIATVPGLIETFARAIALDESDLVVDLSEMRFMGGATVGVLMRTREILHGRSRSLAVRGPSATARRALELCGVWELLGSPASIVPETAGTASVGLWRSMMSADRADRVGQPEVAASGNVPIRPTRTAPSAGRRSAADVPGPVGEHRSDDSGRRGP
jgi:anti-anti-sigma factor